MASEQWDRDPDSRWHSQNPAAPVSNPGPLTAKEARERVAQVVNSERAKERQAVDLKIEGAMKKGQFYVDLYELGGLMVDDLRARGFNVATDVLPDRQGCSMRYRVSW